MRPLVAWLAIPFVSAIACTAFEDLEPNVGGAPADGGGGGDGAGPPDDPRSLLPVLDAANLCSLVFRCPTLGGSILLSTGLPLVQTDAQAQATSWNYSACIDWLTAPLEAGRVGFEELRDVVLLIAPTTTCEDAASLLPFTVAEDPATACASQPTEQCIGTDLVSCPGGITSHCGGPVFAPGSGCGTSSGDAACVSGPCQSPEPRCDDAYVFECNASELQTGYACGVFGLSCAPSEGCVAGSGKPVCGVLGEQTCVGGRARACALRTARSLLAAEVDCGAMGMACVGEGTSSRCSPGGAACSPYDPDQNMCDGSGRVRLCVQGQSTMVDCTLLGKQCVDAQGGKTAHCD